MRWLVFLLLLCLGVKQSVLASALPPIVAISNVTVLDGSGGVGRNNVAVLIRQGRIEAILDNAHKLHPGMERIDGQGGFLLPGFIDMHANLLLPRCQPAAGASSPFDRKISERTLAALLDFGITTVRSPATPAVAGLALRDDLNAGRVRGPRARAAAEPINDPAMSELQFRTHVRKNLAYHPDFLKVHANLEPASVATVVNEAHARGLTVIGDMGRTPWKRAVEIGVDHLTHATDWSAESLRPEHRAAYRQAVEKRGAIRARIDWLELLDPASPEIAATLNAMARAGVSVDPTLVAYDSKFSGPKADRYRHNRYLDRFPQLQADWLACTVTTRDWTAGDFRRWQAAWPKMLKLVAEMNRRGVLLTTGSDLGNPWVIPGESLHQEFELLRKAGIPVPAILRMTGENAARAIGLNDVGKIAAGRRADLVLLSADPRVDIRNTRKIVWTMQGGVVVSRGPGK